jgi:hypothetical protein
VSARTAALTIILTLLVLIFLGGCGGTSDEPEERKSPNIPCATYSTTNPECK